MLAPRPGSAPGSARDRGPGPACSIKSQAIEHSCVDTLSGTSLECVLIWQSSKGLSVDCEGQSSTNTSLGISTTLLSGLSLLIDRLLKQDPIHFGSRADPHVFEKSSPRDSAISSRHSRGVPIEYNYPGLCTVCLNNVDLYDSTKPCTSCCCR